MTDENRRKFLQRTSGTAMGIGALMALTRREASADDGDKDEGGSDQGRYSDSHRR